MSKLKESRIGNVKINITDSNEVLSFILKRLESQKKSKLFYINAHCFNVAQKNKIYLKCINNADIVLNDGVGIEIASKLFKVNFEENMNGTDFTPKLLKLCEQHNFSVFLLGGKPGVSETAAKEIKKDFPKLSIVGEMHGYFEKSNDVIKTINIAKPDVLIVGLGVPLQEEWISKNFEKIDALLFTGVGAFIDFASKKISRAPKFIRKVKLEWVYRLLKEPKRLWKRYIIGNLLFFYYLFKLSLFNLEQNISDKK